MRVTRPRPFILAMTRITANLALALILPVTSCSRTNSVSKTKAAEPTLDVPEFRIAVKLSPNANKRLSSIHEGINVLAMFDGDPLPGQGKYNPPNRDVFLGSAEKRADGNNVATFNGVKIPRRDWDRLADKNYYVTINTTSARLSDQNNLLDCNDPMSQRIEAFSGRIIEVSCWLIGETGAPKP
jgi:hypothetical protein